ncbi:MAG TPA: hypothetical protein VJN39_03750 [Gemmatimonadales bacterium]|nr:hypothetical protein [Gemmatimonadales bacterium]
MTAWRVVRLVSLGVLLAGSAPARAQHPAGLVWTGSARAATLQFTDTTSLSAVGGVIEYQALGWLRFGAAPTLVRARIGTNQASGPGDLPLAIETSGKWGSPLRPELGASLIMTLPTGRAACGLGSGTTNLGVQLGAGMAPSDRLHLSADASRSFAGAITLSSLDQPRSTWIDVDGDIDIAPHWTLSLSAGGDVGGADSGSADREVGGGLSYGLSESLALTVDLSHRLAGFAPRWGLTLSLGTTSTGISALNSLSPLERQRQVFVGGGSSVIHGRGKSRGGPPTGGGGSTSTTSAC